MDRTTFDPSTLDALASFAALGLPLTPPQVATLRRAANELRRLAGEVEGLRVAEGGGGGGAGGCEADRLIEAYQEAGI